VSSLQLLYDNNVLSHASCRLDVARLDMLCCRNPRDASHASIPYRQYLSQGTLFTAACRNRQAVTSTSCDRQGAQSWSLRFRMVSPGAVVVQALAPGTMFKNVEPARHHHTSTRDDRDRHNCCAGRCRTEFVLAHVWLADAFMHLRNQYHSRLVLSNAVASSNDI
jgi:hypothetical protein